jgi:hypothetical protein
MDLTTFRTSDLGGCYDLSNLPSGEFWEVLAQTKHVVYDWGWDRVWVCRAPFVVGYPEGVPTLLKGTEEEGLWLSCGGYDEWHSHLRDGFTGEWGPSSADFCLSLLRSGVKIDLMNVQTWGPKDPEAFLRTLKDSV